MLSEAQKRVQLYLEAAAAPKKKPQPKKVGGKTPGAFHDKLDQKLAVIGKKYGVKITLQRNKTKLPSITVSGLKSLTFDKVSQLFNAIPNTSHMPNKISENVAVFRAFGPRKVMTAGSDEVIPASEKKILLDRTKRALKDTHEKLKKSKDKGEQAYLKRTRKNLYDNVKMLKKIGHSMAANDEPQYIITAKKNGKRVYWKEDGFTALTAKDAEPLDEETADKIERRLQNKDGYTEVKSVPAVMTADDDNSSDDTSEDSDTSDDSDDSDSSDDSDDDSDEDSPEDTSNKADMVKYINDNKISKDSLGGLIDKAASSYTDSLKNDSSVEDIVDFVYSMLGKDDAKAGLKALANKASLSDNGGGV